MYYRLIEATVSQIAQKQRSITRLFPDFYTNPVKVKGVINKGGVRMTGIEKDTWKFQVHSGTEDGKWYDTIIRWKNLVPNLQRLVANRRNWNRSKTKVDLKKIVSQLFRSSDVELSCSCPAQLYWGGDYILSLDKYRAKYGEPENRPPVERNPKEYGAHCKHIQVLMKVLPFYKSTMANWLKKEYGDVIASAEKRAAGKAGKYRAAGTALGRRRAKESIDESGSKSLNSVSGVASKQNDTTNFPVKSLAATFHESKTKNRGSRHRISLRGV